MQTLPLYEEAIEDIVNRVVEPNAGHVDSAAAFPREAVTELGRSGLLGLISSPEVGGRGGGPREAAQVVEGLAGACGSTAMVTCMHYCASAVIEQHGPLDVRRRIAEGRHLTTLAFSEFGSRSQFWAPMSSATADGDSTVVLDARKSWVTAAGEADSYVWSSRPLAAEGASTLWLLPAGTERVNLAGGFDGLGLRGNASRPMVAEGARLPTSARLGPDGGGFEIMMGVVLPYFQVLSAAISLGLMEAAVARTAAHAVRTRYEHLGQSLADQPVTRLHVARMRLLTDQSRGLLEDTLAAMEKGRPDAQLRVLEVKAVAGENAVAVTDLAMRVCGGAAYRKEVGVERVFRDARAATVMAPTTDILLDFIGRAVCGLPLF